MAMLKMGMIPLYSPCVRRSLAVAISLLLAVAVLGASPATAASAPGAQPVAETTPVIPTGTVPNPIIDASTIKLPGQNWGYAYGASIVQTQGPAGQPRYHLFACSTGTELRTVDRIRYVYSDDGIHWSAPVVKVSATGGPGSSDFAACDPSVVYWDGYWYLFYSGLRTVSNRKCAGGKTDETVVRVARSAAVDGDYQKAVLKGSKVTWVSAAAETPANNPLVLIAPAKPSCGLYGAGQQSVVVQDGELHMWWIDDTVPDETAPTTQNLQVYSTTTTNPLNWNVHPHVLNQGAFVALDVKYDARVNAFVQIAVPWIDTTGPYAGISAIPTKYSNADPHADNGTTWHWGRNLVAPEGMPRWSRVEAGISGDAQGHISANQTLVAFGCPHGDCTQLGFDGPATQPKYGWWDMYGFQIDALSTSLFL